jgi:dihydropteroate synthase
VQRQAGDGLPEVFRCGRFALSLQRPLVMGIVNVTADSFSDGGRYLDPAAAVAAAQRLVEEGADIIDIGAESTRPGSLPVPEELEWQRLEPVLRALAGVDRPISVDTRHPYVMTRAIAAGASVVNDVEGFRSTAALDAVADAPVGLVAMHMKGEPQTMQQSPHYEDVVAEVCGFLQAQRDALEGRGVARDRICIDPGFGFGKSLAHNVTLLAGLAALRSLDCPILVGISRKSMVGNLTKLPIDQRLGSSIAAALAAVARGAHIVRVHDVAQTVAALRVWHAVQEATTGKDKDGT